MPFISLEEVGTILVTKSVSKGVMLKEAPVSRTTGVSLLWASLERYTTCWSTTEVTCLWGHSSALSSVEATQAANRRLRLELENLRDLRSFFRCLAMRRKSR